MHSEGTVKEAAMKVGFFDDGVPSQLYTLWWGQVYRGIQNWNYFGSAEAGTSWWNDFCEWAASQPTMAPRGLVGYSQEEVQRNVHILCDDIAKKARNVGTCILHPFLVLFTRLIPLIPLLFHLFPVSIIVIFVISYDISGCSYSYSSTRIFIVHLVHMLLFTPLFLYATLFHTSLTCV